MDSDVSAAGGLDGQAGGSLALSLLVR